MSEKLKKITMGISAGALAWLWEYKPLYLAKVTYKNCRAKLLNSANG
jgi:hypothetical protein